MTFNNIKHIIPRIIYRLRIFIAEKYYYICVGILRDAANRRIKGKKELLQ